MNKRKGFKFKNYVPKKYGYVVDMIYFQGRVIVACQKAVFEIVDDKLIPIKFEVKDEPQKS
jgi:hypothetical protein